MSVQERIDSLSQQRFFVFQRKGPLRIVIKDAEGSPFRVTIGQEHSCSCNSSPLCVHILWILVKFFDVDIDCEILQKTRISEMELQRVIDRKYAKTEKVRVRHTYLKKQKQTTSEEDLAAETEVEARELVEGEVCPICQEVMYATQELEYCRKACGNNVHSDCMKMWSSHAGDKGVTCPICRSDWGTAATKALKTRDTFLSRRFNIRCRSCQRLPIHKKLMHCLFCKSYNLCEGCYEHKKVHMKHSFVCKERIDGEWFPAPTRNSGFAEELIQDIQRRELTPNDYLLLQELDAAPPPLPTFLARSLPKSNLKTSANTSSKHMGTVSGRKKTDGGILESANNTYSQACCYCQSTGGKDWRILKSCSHRAHESCCVEAFSMKQYNCPCDGIPVFEGLIPKAKVRNRKGSSSSHNSNGDSSTSGNGKTPGSIMGSRYRERSRSALPERAAAIGLGVSGMKLSGNVINKSNSSTENESSSSTNGRPLRNKWSLPNRNNMNNRTLRQRRRNDNNQNGFGDIDPDLTLGPSMSLLPAPIVMPRADMAQAQPDSPATKSPLFRPSTADLQNGGVSDFPSFMSINQLSSPQSPELQQNESLSRLPSYKNLPYNNNLSSRPSTPNPTAEELSATLTTSSLSPKLPRGSTLMDFMSKPISPSDGNVDRLIINVSETDHNIISNPSTNSTSELPSLPSLTSRNPNHVESPNNNKVIVIKSSARKSQTGMIASTVSPQTRASVSMIPQFPEQQQQQQEQDASLTMENNNNNNNHTDTEQMKKQLQQQHQKVRLEPMSFPVSPINNGTNGSPVLRKDFPAKMNNDNTSSKNDINPTKNHQKGHVSPSSSSIPPAEITPTKTHTNSFPPSPNRRRNGSKHSGTSMPVVTDSSSNKISSPSLNHSASSPVTLSIKNQNEMFSNPTYSPHSGHHHQQARQHNHQHHLGIGRHKHPIVQDTGKGRVVARISSSILNSPVGNAGSFLSVNNFPSDSVAAWADSPAGESGVNYWSIDPIPPPQATQQHKVPPTSSSSSSFIKRPSSPIENNSSSNNRRMKSLENTEVTSGPNRDIPSSHSLHNTVAPSGGTQSQLAAKNAKAAIQWAEKRQEKVAKANEKRAIAAAAAAEKQSAAAQQAALESSGNNGSRYNSRTNLMQVKDAANRNKLGGASTSFQATGIRRGALRKQGTLRKEPHPKTNVEESLSNNLSPSDISAKFSIGVSQFSVVKSSSLKKLAPLSSSIAK
eukprot:TRINITY_DN11962_c0_g1_i2.p1 TRINITY_DN11962_c0_g1~~TRINITY_DN11962_c0_g1_i2.p1  ORF type:complete len:1227 (+),score=355.87 TRINITY_DN11962_c0_g1_i2:67-3747(+)